ncbi:aminoglycoside phosphotransferase family protein [Methylibium petroleiphilum]|uniref:aminoglycoside phosphotransferase family protein n=1 Tax=Methylibium petroleiphilum TaxID=105560 RepID=UPI002356A917|nr:phosphotransferase [Methylibium petroleiphilum]
MDWLNAQAAAHGLVVGSLRTASADASFRRYFRIDGRDGPRIVMDAPPAHEDCRPFVGVAALLRGGGLEAPEVLSWDEPHGFMLLSDLGATTYLEAIRRADPVQSNALYLAALDALVRLQRIDAQARVPNYDRALLQRELDLFPTWYIERHCRHTLDDKALAQLQRCFELILDACTAQPAVLVHRDYHSRNLMLPREPGGPPGLLDFQDAVWGPVSYDLASLLRDAYVEWDESTQLDWAVRYWERGRKAGLPLDADFGNFWRDFEWMGLQRHLKVLGIFARLSHRDGKDGYLKDLPLVWRYAHRVASRYNGLGPLAHLLEQLAGTQRESGYTF